jgi:hypothetical protein
MKETGVVIAIKDDMAVVKVERLLTTGGGCCGQVTTREPAFLETRNLCHARIGDQVRVESDYDKVQFRNLVQMGICLAAFIVSLGIGDAVWPRLGITTYKEPLSFGLGMVVTGAAFGIIRRVNKKNPRNIPAACELAPPQII